VAIELSGERHMVVTSVFFQGYVYGNVMNYQFDGLIRLRVESEMVEDVLREVGQDGLVIDHAVGDDVNPGSYSQQLRLILCSMFDGVLEGNKVERTAQDDKRQPS
jgi:hypothetical protein